MEELTALLTYLESQYGSDWPKWWTFYKWKLMTQQNWGDY